MSTLNKNIIDLSVNSMEKHGDDQKFEPFSDVHIFFPIANSLVDPLYFLGFSPNMITTMSTIGTLVAIYFLHKDMKVEAAISYIIGYILDCIDGRMARKYSMTSNEGMAYDGVSDVISNIILIFYLLFNYKMDKLNIMFICIILFLSYMLSLSLGMMDAVANYEKYGSDNFYRTKYNLLKDNIKEGTFLEKILFKLYLFITKCSYDTYKQHYEGYLPTKKKEIYKKLKILKHFGSGNFCLAVAIIILIMKK